MSYTRILYHIVLRTKHSEKSISQQNVSSLYKYIWGIIKNKRGTLYRINGLEDHVHILSDLPPTIALSDYIKDIKVASSLRMKQSGEFSLFRAWSEGYAAFTCSFKERDTLINYIKNQQEHHKKESPKEELKRLFAEHGIEWNERFFPEQFNPLRG
ncbi:MAG: IS200/IS605 family transposase [Bacteroidales bacterium]|nr:IS200/IS605 family transposase [Bacteroidales bacterium]